MLRKIRITLALIFFVCVTLLFLDFTGTLHAWLGWMAKIQFFPAVLALNAGVIVVLVLLTLIFGRVYCSVICPLGVMQDVFAWLGKKQKKNRYTYSKAKSWLRYGMLGLFIIALIAGVGSFVALLEPYSAYGRIASNIFAPVYGWINNLFALMAERVDSYAFYSTDVWLKSLPTFVIAAVMLVLIAVLACDCRAGMEKRPYMVQHCLPGGYRPELPGPFLMAQAGHRYRQVHKLPQVRAQLQGFLHRYRKSQDRLQPLRDLHGLHRQLSQGRHFVYSS